MKWGSAISGKSRWQEALRHCVQQLREQGLNSPDIALLFVTPHFSEQYANLLEDLHKELGPRHLLGCSAGGVIAGGQEAEGQSAVGLMVGNLQGVSVVPFHLEADQLPDMDAPPKAWAQAVGVADRSSKPAFILLADPFSFNPEEMMRGLDYAFPGAVTLGGLASGASRPLQNALFLDGHCLRAGMVGVAMSGNIAMDPIVAQGCRPIGNRFKITECEQNIAISLDGRPTLEALEELLNGLSDRDQELARHSLFIGILNDPLKAQATKKDYLIRNLIGMDTQRGALAIGAMLRPGQTVQFHLRDRQASAKDLTQALERYVATAPKASPAGALLFSCVGRGQNLYGIANHDTGVFAKTVGPLPIGGFFCNGEIGPVEGTTYLHGYTSCFGVLRSVS